MLIWARENGCGWNEDVCSNAAGNNHLEVLFWAKLNGCAWNIEVCDFGHKHVEIDKFLISQGCPCGKV